MLNNQFGFQKTRLLGVAMNRCKINVLAALTNVFLARRQLLAAMIMSPWSHIWRPQRPIQAKGSFAGLNGNSYPCSPELP